MSDLKALRLEGKKTDQFDTGLQAGITSTYAFYRSLNVQVARLQRIQLLA